MVRPGVLSSGGRALPLAAAALLLLLAPGLSRLELDVRNRVYFLEGDPALLDHDRLTRAFGSDDQVYVSAEVEDAFAAGTLEPLLALGEALRALPGVRDLRSPLHSPYLVEEGEALASRSVARAPPRDEAARAAARAEVTGYAPFQGLLIDAAGRRVGFLLRVDLPPDDDQAPARLSRGLDELLADPRWRPLQAVAVGTPIHTALLSQVLRGELRGALLQGLALAGGCLLLLFGARGAAAPLLVVLAALAGTFGLMGWCGVALTPVTLILVTFLVYLGIADSVHVLAAQQRAIAAGAEDPLGLALEETWVPCLWNSLTTAAGFLALLLTPLRPLRELGLFGAAGCGLALVFTWGLLPPLLSGWRRAPGRDPLGGALARIEALALGRPRAAAAAVLLLYAGLAAGLARLTVEQDFKAWFRPDEPLRQRLELVAARMGGAVGVEVLLESPAPEGAARAAVLRELAGFTAWARQLDPTVLRSARAVTDLLEEVRARLDGSRDPPGDEATAAQLLLAAELCDADGVRQLLSLDGSRARVALRLDVVGSARYQGILDALGAEARRRFAPLGVQTTVTGAAVLVARMKDYALESQLQGLLGSFLTVGLLLVALAGSLRLGLLALVPNALPVVAVLGLMGWLGIALEVSNALLGAVAMGVVVDDTVHVVWAYRRALGRLGDVRAALRETIAGAGRGIAASALVLVLCFVAYLGSRLVNVQAFGLLAASTFGLALLGDVVLLPALLTLSAGGEGTP